MVHIKHRGMHITSYEIFMEADKPRKDNREHKKWSQEAWAKAIEKEILRNKKAKIQEEKGKIRGREEEEETGVGSKQRKKEEKKEKEEKKRKEEEKIFSMDDLIGATGLD